MKPDNRDCPVPRGIKLLFLFSWILCANQSMGASIPLSLEGRTDRHELAGPYLEVLEDKTGQLTIHDVSSSRFAASFTSTHQVVSNFGMTDSVFWFRFAIKTGGHDINRWLLLLDHPLIDEVDLYASRGSGAFDVIKSGSTRPKAERAIKANDILLPLHQVQAEKPVYIRVWVPGRAIFPFTVLTMDAYRKLEAKRRYVFGGFSGFLLAVCWLGFYLFLVIRKRFYLIYAVYVLGTLLSILMINGYLPLPTFPQHPWAHHYLKALIWSIQILAGLEFARSFLNTRAHAIGLDRLLKVSIFLFMLFMLAYPLISPVTGTTVINGVLPVFAVVTIIAAVLCYRKGFTPALYFLVSRFSIYLGSTVFSLTNIGLLPFNAVTKHVYLATISCDIVFFSLAIGNHFREMNQRIVALLKNLRSEISRRSAANKALEKQIAERKRLEREIVRISDDERRNISQELHDGLCQQLIAARLRFDALNDRFTAAGLANEVNPLGRLLKEGVDLAYRLSRGLWTAGSGGKGSFINLSELARELGKQSGIPIVIRQTQGCLNCPSENLAQVHYIAREAIFNAIKHANATRIDVLLECDQDRGIFLEIKDNGSGIRRKVANEGSLGIRIMNHRSEMIGGSLQISDLPDGGTRVACVAPCRTA
jgi:signal transduction histidine kinase